MTDNPTHDPSVEFGGVTNPVESTLDVSSSIGLPYLVALPCPWSETLAQSVGSPWQVKAGTTIHVPRARENEPEVGIALDDYNPWNAPGPKRDFILSLGFALQRANSRMLRNADRRRRQARMSGKYSSGTRPSSSDDDY